MTFNHRFSLAMTFLVLILVVQPVAACTIFTANVEGSVLFGSNEDWYPQDTYIFFDPGTNDEYGQVYLGTDDWYAEGAMNSEGLCYDAAAIAPVALNEHPEKQRPTNWPPVLMIERCSTVAEAIQLFNSCRFDSTVSWQLLVADRFGDSAVFTPGNDGEWHFIQNNDSYQVVTNFNLAIDPSYRGCNRYNTATLNLQQMGSNLSTDYFASILNSVHNPGSTGLCTIYSNVFDLVNGEIYLYYMNDFEKVVNFNLEEELQSGGGRYLISDLFQELPTTPTETQQSTEFFPTDFVIITAMVVGIVAIVSLLILRRKTGR
ncbi:MAG: hypothetical protein KAR33_07835 [Candidatus Thorarchaeota archaeon]|nr:hypothetical protein [Candidatus Thorarchaeota archaeon]